MKTFDAFRLRPSRRLLRALVRARRATDGVAAVEFALILPLMLLMYLGSAETTQAVMASRKGSVAVRTLADLVSQQTANVNMTDAQMGSIFNAASAILQPFSTGTTALKVNVSAVSFQTFTANPPASPASQAVSKSLIWVPTQNKLASASGVTLSSTNPGYAAKIRWSVSPSSLASGSTTLSNTAAITRTCSAAPAALTPVDPTVSPAATNIQEGLFGTTPIIVADISYSYTPTFGAKVVQYGWDGSGGMTSKNTVYMQPRNTWATCSGGSYAWICYSAQQAGSCATY